MLTTRSFDAPHKAHPSDSRMLVVSGLLLALLAKLTGIVHFSFRFEEIRIHLPTWCFSASARFVWRLDATVVRWIVFRPAGGSRSLEFLLGLQ